MSGREKRLWIGAAVCLGAIYTAILFARPIVDALRARGALQIVVLAAFVIAAAVVAWRAWRRRPGRREIAALAIAGLLYALVISRLERHEERLHFLEYGLFAGLVEGALHERGIRWSGPLAVVVTLGAGWIDELIQGLVPGRVYDLRDVGFNATAGLLAVVAVTLQRLARRRSIAPTTG